MESDLFALSYELNNLLRPQWTRAGTALRPYWTKIFEFLGVPIADAYPGFEIISLIYYLLRSEGSAGLGRFADYLRRSGLDRALLLIESSPSAPLFGLVYTPQPGITPSFYTPPYRPQIFEQILTPPSPWL